MKTQAWGWLAVGVLAAGLNASYHDGGLRWAHQVANRIEHQTSAVLALATGRADQFFTEARRVKNQDELTPCRLSTALARAESRIVRSDVEFDRFEAMSDREMARLEANRARMEARVARVRIPAVSVSRLSIPTPKVLACPRVPRTPQIKMPVAPVIHVNLSSAGPV